MTERDDAASTFDEETAVSELLAEAGGPVAMPADVEDRLRSVLDELAQERTVVGAGVSTLARRRRWPRAMLAAAAVLVGGYAVGTLALEGTLSGSDEAVSADSATAGSAGSMAESEGAQESRPEDQGLDTDEGRDGLLQDSGSTSALVGASGVPRIRPERLEGDVRRALRVLDRTRVPGQLDRVRQGYCAGEDVAALTDRPVLAVRYTGRRALLVAEPLDGGLVEVTVYSCGGAALDTTVVRDVGR